MVASMLQLHHRAAVEAALPVCCVGHGKHILQGLVHGAVHVGVFQRPTGEMCLLLAGRASTVVAVDGEGWEKLRAYRVRTVDAVLSRVFQGSVAELTQLFVVENPQRCAWGDDVPTAPRWI